MAPLAALCVQSADDGPRAAGLDAQLPDSQLLREGEGSVKMGTITGTYDI